MGNKKQFMSVGCLVMAVSFICAHIVYTLYVRDLLTLHFAPAVNIHMPDTLNLKKPVALEWTRKIALKWDKKTPMMELANGDESKLNSHWIVINANTLTSQALDNLAANKTWTVVIAKDENVTVVPTDWTPPSNVIQIGTIEQEIWGAHAFRDIAVCKSYQGQGHMQRIVGSLYAIGHKAKVVSVTDPASSGFSAVCNWTSSSVQVLHNSQSTSIQTGHKTKADYTSLVPHPKSPHSPTETSLLVPRTTTYTYDSLWGLLLPCSAQAKFRDVWAKLWQQRLLSEITGQSLDSYDSVIVDVPGHMMKFPQMRESDIVDIYYNMSSLLTFLKTWKCDRKYTFFQCVVLLGHDLKNVGFWSESDVQVVQNWVTQLLYFGYKEPKRLKGTI